jgi:hypothetical protein
MQFPARRRGPSGDASAAPCIAPSLPHMPSRFDVTKPDLETTDFPGTIRRSYVGMEP